MIRRPPRSTLSSSSAASDVYKRQVPPRGRVAALGFHGKAQRGTGSARRTEVGRVSAGPDSRPLGRSRREREPVPRRVFQQVKLTEDEQQQLRARAAALGVSVPRLMVESALGGATGMAPDR